MSSFCTPECGLSAISVDRAIDYITFRLKICDFVWPLRRDGWTKYFILGPLRMDGWTFRKDG